MPVIPTPRRLQADLTIVVVPERLRVRSRRDRCERRHRQARLREAAALLEFVLGVDEGFGAGFDGDAVVDKQLRVLVRHMLVIKRDRVRALDDRAQILKVGVVADADITEDLRRRLVLTRREHASVHAELDSFCLHHSCQLAVAKHGDNRHPIRVTHAPHCSRPTD